MTFDPAKPVRLRNGWKARIICTDRRDNSMPIVYLYDDGSGEGVRCAFANGMATEAPDDENIDLAVEPNPYDLINVDVDTGS
ncbi:hypothetical protein [Microvirga sp. G4-2]|uniref:hypothetical protein n=1 Tax=Microvirga sp. G4-2 TaxID=3434467 RepID=UPI004043B187